VRLKIDRDRAAVLLTRPRLRSRSYSAIWAALVVHHLWGQQSIQGSAWRSAQVSGFFGLSIQDLLQDAQRLAGAAGQFRHLKESAGPQKHQSFRQLPSVTVSFNLKPGVSLGQAVS